MAKMWLSSTSLINTAGDIKPLLVDITAAKIQHFAAEARVLDASEIKEFNLPKRITLILCLIYSAQVTARDNLVEMFMKKIKSIHLKKYPRRDLSPVVMVGLLITTFPILMWRYSVILFLVELGKQFISLRVY
jgi:hypothetical protein